MYLAALSCKPQRLVVVWLSVAMALINGFGRYKTLNVTPLQHTHVVLLYKAKIVRNKIMFGLFVL